MRRAAELEQRLMEWGREYGGGTTEYLGYPRQSSVATMMTYRGPAPRVNYSGPTRDRTPADDVQDAVSALAAQQDGWQPAACLRAEYMTPGLAVESRIQGLRRIGISVSRVRYYQLLREGRVYVAGRLGLSYSAARSSNGLEPVL